MKSTTAVFLLAWSCFSIYTVSAGGPTKTCRKELQFNNYVTNCYYPVNKGQNYNGKLSVTKSGLKCQRWDTNNPHEIDECFEKHSHNYCRNPLGKKMMPYCYTMSSTVKLEMCNIPRCSSLTPQTELPTSSPTPNATSHTAEDEGLSIGVIGLAVGLCTIFVVLFVFVLVFVFKCRRRKLNKALPYPAKDMKQWKMRDEKVKKIQRKTANKRNKTAKETRKKLESIGSSETSDSTETH